jgi:phosphate-selective porin OprO and OprP
MYFQQTGGETRFGRGQRRGAGLLLALFAAGASGCPAGEPPAAPAAVQSGGASELASLWDRATLVPRRSHGLLRGLALTGRLHYDYVNLDSSTGGDEFTSFRRVRTGFRATLPRGWEVKTEVEFDLNDADPLYDGLTDAYLAWRPDPAWTFKVGKQAAFFTLEGATSSNELITMERSNLANNLWFPALFIPGVTGEHALGDRRLFAGLYSGGGATPEFGDFDGSVFALLKVEEDFADRLRADEAILALHAVIQDPDPDNTFTRPHGEVFSVNFRYREGPWRLQTDLARSHGSFDQPDLTGLVLMPGYDISEAWQIIARATFIDSDGPGGIRLARPENRLTTDRGDRYGDYYLGLNRYFHGHKLKWQTGVSYHHLHDLATSGGDHRGWTYSTGIRISW